MASRICTKLSTFSRRALNECRSLCLGRPLLFAVGDTPDREPYVPPYRERFDEPLKVKKARLLYQSRKRGILENELLLSTFAAKYLDKMDEEQLEEYDRLINLPTNDWDIYYWITGKELTPVEFHSKVMELLKKHVYNRERECRTRMPDLY